MSKKLPPKCLTNRWGSAHLSEQHVLKCERSHLHAVCSKAFERASKKRKHKDDELQPDTEEAMAQYSAKMGRWRREVVLALSNSIWWCLLEVSHKARAPWHHFHLSIMKRSGRAGTRPDGDNGHGYVALLVNGKAAMFAAQFDSLLALSPWTDILSGEAAATLSEDGRSNLHSAIVALVVNGAAEFDVRVKKAMEEWPQKMRLLVAEPADSESASRVEVI